MSRQRKTEARRSKKRPKATPRKSNGKSYDNLKAYEKRKKREALRQSEFSRAGRDVSKDCPKIVDRARRERCRLNFSEFCRTYFPDSFYLPWSPDHLKVIAKIQNAVMRGGLFAFAMPRASGKSELCEKAADWALLYGHRKFVVIIGSDEASACEMANAIKSELENNELLYEDFPEVCHPIRKLEGIANRASGQTWKDTRTAISWTAKQIVLPTVPGSKASAGVVNVAGLTGRIRGMKFKRPDGRSVRPDLVIIDDPQTNESANSPSQCAEREKIIGGAVLGLAGPGSKISGFMPCTVINADDLAERTLDREKHPEWQGERMKLMIRDPDNADLWEQYAKLRQDGLRDGDEGRKATEFYRLNREAMDKGAVPAWPERFNYDQLSAIQYAMDLKIDNPATYAAEYQNEPITLADADRERLSVDDIMQKQGATERHVLPPDATRVTAFVDVQKEALFYAVFATDDEFNGTFIDYGAYPDQKRDYFKLSDARNTLGLMYPKLGLETRIRQGLDGLLGRLMTKQYRNARGVEIGIELCAIDANWGESTDIVYQTVRESEFRQRLLASHGQYIGAKHAPITAKKKQPGERVGLNWRVNQSDKRLARYLRFDTNFWKSFLHARLAVPAGGRGCVNLFCTDSHRHRMFAEHIDAEYAKKVTVGEREVMEFMLRPSRPDNHLLDCSVGCMVCASIAGASMKEHAKESAKSGPRKVSFRQQMEAKQQATA